MNNKGQMAFIGIMTAIVLFIAMVQFIDPIKEQITDARTAMSCESDSITTGTKLGCIVIGLYLFYFIGAGIAVSIGAISGYSMLKKFKTSG